MTNMERVRRVLYAWSHDDKLAGGTGLLPPPFPEDFDAAVVWWSVQMQEGRQPGEDADQHATRVAQALYQFVHESDGNRKFILGAIQDGVPYRGDRIDVYEMICIETMKQRSGDKDAYRLDALKKLRALTGKRS